MSAPSPGTWSLTLALTPQKPITPPRHRTRGIRRIIIQPLRDGAGGLNFSTGGGVGEGIVVSGDVVCVVCWPGVLAGAGCCVWGWDWGLEGSGLGVVGVFFFVCGADFGVLLGCFCLVLEKTLESVLGEKRETKRRNELKRGEVRKK